MLSDGPNALVRDGLGRVGQGGEHVFVGDSEVLSDLFLSHATRELSDDRLDGDTSPLDHGLAEMDRLVDDDPGCDFRHGILTTCEFRTLLVGGAPAATDSRAPQLRFASSSAHRA